MQYVEWVGGGIFDQARINSEKVPLFSGSSGVTGPPFFMVVDMVTSHKHSYRRVFL